MTIAITQRVITTTAVVLAVWAGWQLAHGSMLPMALLGSAAVAMISGRLLTTRFDAVLGSLVLFGLIVGNRGFAQFTPTNLPLLPAEAALAFGSLMLLWKSASARTLPLRADGLNIAVLLWMVLSSLRLPSDVRQFGLLAIRDFAMVYYAAFFFIAQSWGSEATSRRWLERSLLAGLIISPFAFEAFKAWPDVLVAATEFRGVPLIFIKGDSAAAIMAGGAAWCGCLAASRRHIGFAALAFLLLTSVLLSNSRAALVALFVIAFWLVVARAWRVLRQVTAYGVIAIILAGTTAVLSQRPWHESELYRTYERLASVVDLSGTRTYRSSTLQDKGDNNDFRLTWWRVAAGQTWAEDKWFGVGFGRELAAEFARIYYPEVDETFTARSPHNIVLSVFARSGLIGLAAYLAILAFFVRQTWRACRHGVDAQLAWWLFAWGIFVSACFGVILEGPMGAVVFWTVLGLANHRKEEESSSETEATQQESPAEALAPGAESRARV